MLSGISIERLDTCHPALQRIVSAVAEEIPIQVICGHRNKEDQDKAFSEKKSKVKYPNSKHNTIPSNAVDIAPLKIVDGHRIIDWNDRDLFASLANLVFKYAYKFGVHIRWGGDFNMDGTKTINDDWDLPHFEIREA